VTPNLRNFLFETLYKNRYLYRFASTVPFAGQWRTWQRQVLPRLQGHDVLELGCGLGDLLADMLDAGYMCRAIEHSPEMVRAARETLERRKVGVDSWIVQGEAQRLPFADSSFDSVVSTFPANYIFDPDTIAEVSRVLRPGGRLIIVLGGELLPVGYFQPLLLLLHVFVYGTRGFFGRAGQRSAEQTMPDGIATEELPANAVGALIPLEQFGLRRHAQRVYTRRWELFMLLAEKASIEHA
jgi:SAM-dependent methyltransferase